MSDTVLVLDAMGVIYAAADDVEELLIPLVLEHGGLDDHAAIHRSLQTANCLPESLLFVDDRTKNLDAARALGIRTIRFDPLADASLPQAHACVRSFQELADIYQKDE